MTDTEIKIKGIEALMKSLGEVGAERFIALIQREPFDYTEWQRNLWEGQSIEEISRKAMELRRRQAEQGDAADSHHSRFDSR